MINAVYSLLGTISNQSRKIRINSWKRRNSRRGNVHLGIREAVKKRIPFSDVEAYLRPTVSDSGRVGEFVEGIYFSRSYLHDSVVKQEPRLLIDVGANIGLSTLSLLGEFKSVTKVIGIEAEKNNFEILSKNFELWQENFSDVEFVPLHAVATASSEAHIVEKSPLHTLTGENSASGTFRYDMADSGSAEAAGGSTAIAIGDLLTDMDPDDGLIVKIDIEGGEQHLLAGNTDWLGRVTFLTIEVHDRYHEVMIESSRNLLRALCEWDFAVAPEKDVLHCYPRRLFGA